jgi:hypothetical protein
MRLIPPTFKGVCLAISIAAIADAFVANNLATTRTYIHLPISSSKEMATEIMAALSIEQATEILLEWDRSYSPDAFAKPSITFDENISRPKLPQAVKCLNEAARSERDLDCTKGRCMLGICASSAQEGIMTLKSWVSALELPRGMLHGMDKDGIPLELEGAVYIKYNTGGSLTFSDIRNSGIGLDAIWRPGDALLELYDGKYRGVYFQVELFDSVFRQFLVPLDVFANE